MTRAWAGASRALMAGNFAIGCGVMVVAGSMNDLSHALEVSPAVTGQLITAGAVALGVGAPLLAAAFAGWDRRFLLTLALLWFAIGHALSALMPSYATLLPLRVLSLLAAAVFTPQAAAAIGTLAPAEQRGQAITTVFLGWSISSVLGMPASSFIAQTWGWRWAFVLVALLAGAAAWGVWRTMPAGVRPPALSWPDWRGALTHPVLMGMVAVTALSAAAQFTVFSYMAPYFHQVLGASATQISLLFLWFGAFGLLGNVMLSRHVDRVGAARGVNIALVLIGTSLLLWPLAAALGPGPGLALTVALLVPWALGCFSTNSGQQARLAAGAPAYVPALMAMNTSAIYVGQAVGAGGGGVLLSRSGFAPLPWAALGWLALALTLSLWATRRMRAAHA